MNIQTLASSVNTKAAVQPSTAAGKVQGAPKAQKSGEESRPLRPSVDEYILEEKREPSGRYWMGRDGNGQPKVYFDDPERSADAPEEPEKASGAESPEAEEPERGGGAKAPEKKEGREEVWEGSTDQVDREIERLKKKREELENRLNTETNEAKIKDLERQLAQVERELKQKDNDTYRKQHSTFTRLR